MSDFWFWICLAIYILVMCIGIAYSWSQLDDGLEFSDRDEGILYSIFWPLVLDILPFYLLIMLFKMIFDNIFGKKYRF